MALFTSRKRDAKIAEDAASLALEKAGLAGSPIAGANASISAPLYPSPGDQVHTLGNVIPMDRPVMAFDSIMGPGRPLIPAAIDEVDPVTGRAPPRRWQYDVAHNLNLSQTEVPWEILTSLYQQCDVVWRSCEIRIDEITKMDRSFGLTDSCIAEIMEAQNCSHAKAAQIGRDKYGEELTMLTEFWDNPYPEMYRGFTEWLTEGLWSFFPFDAMVIYPRYNLGGKLMGLEWIDPRTIKPLLDSRGFTPLPPAPAYQQILYGFPRGEFSASPESDGEFYGVTPDQSYKTDSLIYSVKNRRTTSPYGYSMVEAMVPAATVYLERQRWMREQFQSGSMATSYMLTDTAFTPVQAAEWNRYLNDHLQGQTQARQQTQALPAGFKPEFSPQQEEKYKADLDEFFIKRVAAIGGISPSALGVVPRSGLGGKGEASEASDQAELVSQKPTEKHVTELINRISRQLVGSSRNTSFVLHDNKTGMDDLNTAKGFQVSLYSGQKTLNMIQDELGQPLYEMPEADEPFIVAGNTIQFLKGMLDVDPTGETIGQKPKGGPVDNPQGQEGQVPQGNGQTPPSNGQEGPEPRNGEAGPAALERKKFASFMAKRAGTGQWRDFEFSHIDGAEADQLNKAGRLVAESGADPKGLSLTKRALSDLPGHADKEKIIAHYTPKVLKALGSVTGLPEAISTAMSSTRTKAVDPDHAKQVAKGAIHQHVVIDSEAMVKAIRDIYGDSGMAGTIAAIQQVGSGAAVGSGIAGLVSDMDWSKWVPGHPSAALKVANGGLRDLLQGANINLKGIDRTTLDRLGNALADGLTNGSTSKEIASALNDIVGDPHRAQMIATTESNRAFVASTIDNYRESGVEQFDWLAYDDACPECADAEANNPHDLSDDTPPAHPNCRCAVAAVIPGITDN